MDILFSLVLLSITNPGDNGGEIAQFDSMVEPLVGDLIDLSDLPETALIPGKYRNQIGPENSFLVNQRYINSKSKTILVYGVIVETADFLSTGEMFN